jgi:hypothetical protein
VSTDLGFKVDVAFDFAIGSLNIIGGTTNTRVFVKLDAMGGISDLQSGPFAM